MQVLNSQISIHHTRLRFEVLSRWVEGKIFGVGGNTSLVLRPHQCLMLALRFQTAVLD